MPRIAATPIAAIALLAACATAPVGEDLGAYPRALAGAWSNGAQYAAAPADMKHAPAGPEDDWLDRVTVQFSPAATPAAPAAALAEWRGDDGKLLGRGLWAFRSEGGAVKLDLYEVRDPAALAPADLVSRGPGCALAVTPAGNGAFNAQTDPDACVSSGVHLDIRITAMPTGILYQERRRSDDGALAAQTPGGVPYDLRRVP